MKKVTLRVESQLLNKYFVLFEKICQHRFPFYCLFFLLNHEADRYLLWLDYINVSTKPFKVLLGLAMFIDYILAYP